MMETALGQNVDFPSWTEKYADAQRYFLGQGWLNHALSQLAEDLKCRSIDYAVIGGVALFAHGYRRFTNNIDVVLTPEGLRRFLTPLGSNYDQDVTSKKRVRSFPHGITIDLMTTGEYPGDGKPKPVSIPDPSAASIEIDGVRFVTIEKLVELKLASGMTAPHRLKDLADVQELIKIRDLQPEFAAQLNPYVRDKFSELYESVEKSRGEE